MRKHQQRKLSLNAETVLLLTTERLSGVVGGDPTTTSDRLCTQACPSKSCDPGGGGRPE
jgi:hypothetical protein